MSKKNIFFILSLALFTLPAFCQGLIFIVNEKNPVLNLSKTQLLNFYQKRSRFWPDGTPVRFFDRADGSPERELFLNNYLNKSLREVEEYWIGQKLHTGNSAPTQVANDNMVRALVVRFPGAIGYVNPNFPITGGIKKIHIDEKNAIK